MFPFSDLPHAASTGNMLLPALSWKNKVQCVGRHCSQSKSEKGIDDHYISSLAAQNLGEPVRSNLPCTSIPCTRSTSTQGVVRDDNWADVVHPPVAPY